MDFRRVLQHNVFRSDPVLNSDSAGRFFYLSLLQNFFDDLWRSLNGGQSWANIAPAYGGDKQWFTIDNITARDMDFSTNPGAATATITAADNSPDRSMAESPG